MTFLYFTGGFEIVKTRLSFGFLIEHKSHSVEKDLKTDFYSRPRHKSMYKDEALGFSNNYVRRLSDLFFMCVHVRVNSCV